MRVKKHNGRNMQQNRRWIEENISNKKNLKNKIKKRSRESDSSKDRQRSLNILIMSSEKEQKQWNLINTNNSNECPEIKNKNCHYIWKGCVVYLDKLIRNDQHVDILFKNDWT